MITLAYQLVNRALRKLGANSITAAAWATPTTDQNAIVMNDLYDDSLRILLCDADWQFARKRAALVRSSDATAIEWTKHNLIYIYDVPSDFLVLRGWSEGFQTVRQEGDYIISDSQGGNTTVSVNESSLSAWVSGTSYTKDRFILRSDYVYYCKVSHTSATASAPGTGADWETYWTLCTENITGVWTAVIDKPLGIIYTYYNTTIAQYPPYFIEAFTDKLAIDACGRIKQSNQKEAMLEERADESLRNARAINSQGQTQTSVRADAWDLAKYSGHKSWDNTGLYYR